MPSREPDSAKDSISAPESRARLVVFDFDGTSIKGSSPVMLVRYLKRKKMLKKRVIVRILFWALAYKLRLPQNESWVRGLVFTAFEGKPAKEVDAFLGQFYDDCVEPMFRPKADAAMQKHQSAGDMVLVISASFEPIVVRAMQSHCFHHQISTRMRVAKDGTYLKEVDGLPVEGAEKLVVVTRFGNEHFGVGNWELACAYGDHHSDRAVLSAAQCAYVVNPDRPLSRTARDRGWKVLDW